MQAVSLVPMQGNVITCVMKLLLLNDQPHVKMVEDIIKRHNIHR
jgi:hypothetical protein